MRTRVFLNAAPTWPFSHRFPLCGVLQPRTWDKRGEKMWPCDVLLSAVPQSLRVFHLEHFLTNTVRRDVLWLTPWGQHSGEKWCRDVYTNQMFLNLFFLCPSFNISSPTHERRRFNGAVTLTKNVRQGRCRKAVAWWRYTYSMFLDLS